MTKARGKRFSPVGTTAPNADEVAAPAKRAQTSRRPDAQTSAPAASKGIKAYTWRIDTDRANRLDALVLRLRVDLAIPQLDRATMLEAITDLADENQGIYGALLARLQDVLDV
ncbi:MAG: hypothetical protein ACRDP6_29270 [Actinoallomurus sp.]